MAKINFEEKEYKLFFSNNLPPLLALNYADELFFDEFERLCGERYRILSIIKEGWQEKFGLTQDIKILAEKFREKLNDFGWADKILEEYEKKAPNLRAHLADVSEIDFSNTSGEEMGDSITKIRELSAPLDAMSNMLHMFSELVGYEFFKNLSSYTAKKNVIKENFVYFTQPIKESRFAKISEEKPDNVISLSDRDNNFSKILRVGAYIKDDVSHLLSLRQESMESLLRSISKKISIPKERIVYLQTKEIKSYLSGDVFPKNILEERYKITVIFYNSRDLIIKEGKGAERFLTEGNLSEIKEEETFKKYLKGQPASSGKASGKVVIANKSEDANSKLQEGNILVAPYTAVEYVPAMKKSSAIITETGGIISHAAIVSRELGIPCVIGVSDVTKILKDGDLVEVDANEGIIKVLEKN